MLQQRYQFPSPYWDNISPEVSPQTPFSYTRVLGVARNISEKHAGLQTAPSTSKLGTGLSLPRARTPDCVHARALACLCLVHLPLLLSIFLHYFVLLNMVIAIVVDAYMEVKGDQQSRTVSLLKQNMGTLSENISSDLRRLTLSLLVFFRTSRVYSLLFPHRKHERHFVPWSDAVWTQATRHRRH